jgi:hypoxanthine-DNA glycosylase
MAPVAAGARKRSFAPVIDGSTRVLVLGSLPGEISLARAQYYAHPRNQFWRLLEPIINAPLVELGYDARLDALQAAGLGLWDVIHSARRAGSLDGAIRASRPNALKRLVDAHPGLRALAFNGATAAALGRRLLAEPGALALLDLPSSSPAYTLPLTDKQRDWDSLRPYLAGVERGRA